VLFRSAHAGNLGNWVDLLRHDFSINRLHLD